MKTLMLLLSVMLLPLAASHGQQPVYDAVTDGDVKTLHTDFTTLDGLYTTAMNTANGYLSSIKDSEASTATAMTALTTAVTGLVTVIGDPSKITVGNGSPTKSSVQALSKDISTFNTNASSNGITYSSDQLKHFTAISDGVPEMLTPAVDLNNFYNETAGGMFQPIGGTYTPLPQAGSKTTPSAIARGTLPAITTPSGNPPSPAPIPTSYLPEASEIAAANSYFQVRDSALTRREALQAALADAVTALDTAPNFATVSKISALIQALQSQMQSCNDDINIAFNDMAVRGMQVYAMNSALTKSSAEPAQAQIAANLAAANDLTAHPPTSNSGNTTSIPGGIVAPTGMPATGSGAVTGYTTNFFPWTVYQ